MKSDQTKFTNYIHNSQNQLLKIQVYNGTNLLKETNYFYDAIGRRVQKIHDDFVDNDKSFAKKYVYDSQEILAEFDQDNNLKAIFTHSGLRTDDVLSVDKEGVSYFYLKDHLGTIEHIVNNSGNIIQSYLYSPFGEIRKIEDGSGADITNSSALENSYTFTGREFDKESGLYYYRARYYDSSVGRFITVDPHPGILNQSLTFNSKYLYVVNNPIMGIDPEGEIWPVLIAAAIGGFVNAHINNGNGKSWLLNFAIGAAVAGGGAVAVTAAAGYAGTNIALGFIYGSGAGAATSWAGQMIINESTDQSKISWLGVGLGGLAGGIGGGFTAAAKANFFATPNSQTAIESIDAVNKGAVQGVADKAESIKRANQLKVVMPPLH